MIQHELFNRTDFGQIDIEALESLVTGLKDAKNDESDLELLTGISDWVINGWKYIVDHSDQLDSDSNGTITKLATVWTRLTRDLVGYNKDCQDALRPTIHLIIKTLWLTSGALRLDHADFKLLNQFGAQALSNLITSNPTSINHVWPLLVDCKVEQSVLLRLLYTKNNRLVLAVAVLMLNSINKNLPRIESLINSPVGKKAMTMLLERLDGLLDEKTNPVFEVIVRLVQEIIDVEPLTQAPKLYYSQAADSQILSPAQLSILKILENSTVLPSPTFLLKEFERFSGHLEDTWQGFVLVIEMLAKRIEKLEGNVANLDESDGDISDCEACKAVEISVRILKELSVTRHSIVKTGQEHKIRSVNQILIELVKFLSCLIEFKSLTRTDSVTAIQDLVRNLDGLPVILSFTKFDVDFAYLREHSILLIKYLLKNNQKNQAFVEGLKPV